MNAIQQEIHRVSDAIARYDYLKSKNIETTDSNMRKVNKNEKEFKTIFRDIKKRITDHNTPVQTMSVDELLKMPHI
jgi:hemerythrin superfamily protein